MTPETKTKKAILAYMKTVPGFYVFSVPLSGYNIGGIADILGVWDGHFIAIEVKSPKAYATFNHNMSELQKSFKNKVEKAGGWYICTDGIERLKKELFVSEIHLEIDKAA